MLRQGSRFEPTILVHGNLGPQNFGPHVLGAAGIWGHIGFWSTRGTAHVSNPLPIIWFTRVESSICLGAAWAGGPHGFAAARTLRVAPSQPPRREYDRPRGLQLDANFQNWVQA